MGFFQARVLEWGAIVFSIMVSSHAETNDQGIQTIVLTTQGSSTPCLPRLFLFLKNLEIRKIVAVPPLGRRGRQSHI